MRELERVIMLRVVDEYWMDHIDAMDDLKQDVNLRAYANEKPITPTSATATTCSRKWSPASE
jgi:preprotein translocase subunit SecA